MFVIAAACSSHSSQVIRDPEGGAPGAGGAEAGGDTSQGGDTGAGGEDTGGASGGGRSGSTGTSGNDSGGSTGEAGESAGGATSEGGASTGGANQGGTPDAGGAPSGGSPAAACYTAVVTGNAHSCALRSDGTLWCWGKNAQGQLGLGTSGIPHPEPERVPGLGGIVRIAAKAGGFADMDHTCALEGDGDVFCWGTNRYGEVGDGSFESMLPPTKVLRGASDIVTGPMHSCALGDQVYCWGGGSQAGASNNRCEGSTSDNCILTPKVLTGFAGPPDALSAGETSTCGLNANGVAYCWGSGAALASETGTGPFSSPVLADQLGSEIEEIDIGSGYSCARKTDGSLWCVGSSPFGGLGLGSVESAPTSQEIEDLGGDAADLGIGAGVTCVVKTDGSLWCWGRNDHGQVGPGSSETCSDQSYPCVKLPTEVPGIDDVTQVSPGATHTCAVRADGTVWCWGLNMDGQLGDGSYENSQTPLQVELPCPEGCHPLTGYCPSLGRDECDDAPGCAYEVGICSGEPSVCSVSCGLGCQSGCGSLGTPLDCESFNGSLCTSQGCTWGEGECVGSTLGCSVPDQTTCQSRFGCAWYTGTNQFCSGVQPACATWGGSGCDTQGCTWSDSGCYGTPTNCEGLDENACADEPGCGWL